MERPKPQSLELTIGMEHLVGLYKEIGSYEAVYTNGPSIGVKLLVAVEGAKFIDFSPKPYERGEDISKRIGYGINRTLEGIVKKFYKFEIDSDPATAQARVEERLLFEFAFKQAGLDTIFVEGIFNRYDKEEGNPWYRVTTKMGHFIVGRRKRVYALSWDETLNKHRGSLIFIGKNSVESTVSDYEVHAWTPEELASHIEVIYKDFLGTKERN